MNVIFVTGGARSGKSRYAEQMALALSDTPIYLATSRIWDADHQRRIKRHQSERDPHWITLEEEKEIGKLNLEGKVVVLDCITLWLTNYFSDLNYDAEKTLVAAKAEWDYFLQKNATAVVVSNEIGMGVHAMAENTRKFVDLQGWMNQYIARQAGKVILMVSGIPLTVK